jgi:hypothetical protein
MEYLNKIMHLFSVEEITDDSLKISKDDFEVVVLEINDKLFTKFGQVKDYEKLYKLLLKEYNKHLEQKIEEKIKLICKDCKIKITKSNIKIFIDESYLLIQNNSVKLFTTKDKFNKFLEIQNKLYEIGLIDA